MAIDKSSSEWLFFKRHPSWLRSSRFLRDFYRNLIITEENAYPGFSERLRLLALDILSEEGKPDDLQEALSVLSVVGTEDDILAIERLNELETEDLTVDVKTCVYEIKQKNGNSF